MKYFKMEEFERSEKAKALRINNNIPVAAQIRIKDLVENVLDPIREYIRVPIRINSGYRCTELNKAVGGVNTSQHTKGEAADITTFSPSLNAEIVKFVIDNIIFDQMIVYKNFIHISYTHEYNRRQVLKGHY